MELRDRWNHLLPGSRPLGQDLLARYAEPHRYYHDQRHLAEVLDAVEKLAGEAADPDTVRLAAWFHDAIYDARAAAGENEEASAQLAEAELSAYGLDDALVTEVGRLIRLTTNHRCRADDANAAVLCDADLQILAADGGRYDEYAADVRKEYAHVGDRDFARGRTAVLERIAGGPVYLTEHGREVWRKAARENLHRELARLYPAAQNRWAGLVPVGYLGASLGLVLAASVLLGRGLAAAPSWPAGADLQRSFPWWTPAVGAAAAALAVLAWLRRARPRVMLGLCAPMAVAGAAGVAVTWLRWPQPTPGTAMSERLPYLLLASITTLLGGVLLGTSCRLRTRRAYSARPPRAAGLLLAAVCMALAGWMALVAGAPFVQARLEAANTISETATEPPTAAAAVRLDGELAWSSRLSTTAPVYGTAGGLATLRPDGVVMLDAATGQTRWSYRRTDVSGVTAPGAHGLLVSSDRRTLAVHLPPGISHPAAVELPTYAVLDATTGTVLSEVHAGGTALAVDRDHLIVADGGTVTDHPTGNENGWRVRSECPAIRAELVTGIAVVLATCSPSGTQTMRGLDVTDGAQRWQLDVGAAAEANAAETAGSYRIARLVAVPGTRQVAGLGWSAEAGGTLYHWVADAGAGTLTWSAALPGSQRPRPGSGSCDPAITATPASLVVLTCRPGQPGVVQTYDVAATNPADGTPLWHHLLAVPVAVQYADYVKRGFALMADGRVVTMLPAGNGCTLIHIGTTGVQQHKFVTGEVALPRVSCRQPYATLAAGRPVLGDGTLLLALR